MTRVQALSDIVLGLLLALAGGIVAALLGRAVGGRVELPLLPILAVQGVIILLGLHLLLRRRGRRWAELRLPAPRWLDIGRAGIALLEMFAASITLNLVTALFSAELVEEHQRVLSDVAGVLTDGLSTGAIAAIMLFVGIYEELLARGFLLRRSQTLLGGTWGPVLLSSLLFGLGHVYQGWTGVVQTAVVGVVLARLVLHWGTLWPAIFAHAALNTLSVMVLRLVA